MNEDFKKRSTPILEALSQYQRKGVVHIDQPTANKMLEEESDRGMVIILGSFIEDKLMERISEKLPAADAAQISRMTKGGGPLKDFASKTVVARAMGIIDDEQVDFLTVIRAMRNACAHSKQDMNFEIPQLRRALALLFVDKDADEIATTAERGMLRIAFLCAAGFVLGVLSGESDEHARGRIKEVVAGAKAWAQTKQLTAWPDKLSDTPILGLRWFPTGTGH